MATYDPNGGEKPSFTWDEGRYKAIIELAEEKTSKAGNPMVQFTIKCFRRKDGNQQEHRVWEYCTLNSAGGIWTLEQVSLAIGNHAAFKSGKFNSRDYVDRNLEVELGIKSDAKYGDKNVVSEYVVPGAKNERATAKMPEEEKYDDYATSLPGTGGEEPPF